MDAPRDGLIAVVKHDCPTCVLTVPVLATLAQAGGLTVYCQDDPAFPAESLTGSTTTRSTPPTSWASRSCPP